MSDVAKTDDTTKPISPSRHHSKCFLPCCLHSAAGAVKQLANHGGFLYLYLHTYVSSTIAFMSMCLAHFGTLLVTRCATGYAFGSVWGRRTRSAAVFRPTITTIVQLAAIRGLGVTVRRRLTFHGNGQSHYITSIVPFFFLLLAKCLAMLVMKHLRRSAKEVRCQVVNETHVC